jgi:hypothetical protein
MTILYRTVLLASFLPVCLFGQQRIVTISTGSEIVVPSGSILCADVFYANNSGFGTLTYASNASICKAAVIPVELMAFTGARLDTTVQLSWTTASERVCAGFDVQRQGGSGTWQTVGFVSGHGTSGQRHDYGYADPLSFPLRSADTLIYRLRMLDMDGAVSYSPELVLGSAQSERAAALFSVFPNPATDAITVRTHSQDASSMEIAVYDLSGQELQRFTHSSLSKQGVHDATIPISSLPNGNYFLSVTAGTMQAVRSFVVKR